MIILIFLVYDIQTVFIRLCISDLTAKYYPFTHLTGTMPRFEHQSCTLLEGNGVRTIAQPLSTSYLLTTTLFAFRPRPARPPTSSSAHFYPKCLLLVRTEVVNHTACVLSQSQYFPCISSHSTQRPNVNEQWVHDRAPGTKAAALNNDDSRPRLPSSTSTVTTKLQVSNLHYEVTPKDLAVCR